MFLFFKNHNNKWMQIFLIYSSTFYTYYMSSVDIKTTCTCLFIKIKDIQDLLHTHTLYKLIHHHHIHTVCKSLKNTGLYSKLLLFYWDIKLTVCLEKSELCELPLLTVGTICKEANELVVCMLVCNKIKLFVNH